MQFHSLHSLVIALLLWIAPSAATFGFFDWTDCITNWDWDEYDYEHHHDDHHNDKPNPPSTPTDNCAVPSIVVAENKKRNDQDEVISFEKRTFGSYFPKAALGVSQVTKKEDDLYEVVCNFKAANADYLKSTVPNDRVKKLSFSNTGCGSDFHLIKDSQCQVDSWCEWSTSIVVKPEKSNGKCCLPAGLSLDIEFQVDSSAYMQAWDAVYEKSFGWSCDSEASSSFSAVDNWDSYFSFSKSKRDSSLTAENVLNKGESQQKKRFLNFQNCYDEFTSYACEKPTFDKFCWDCSCDTPPSPPTDSKTVPPSPPTDSKTVPPSPPSGSKTVPPSPPSGSETVPPSPPAGSETVPCEECSKTTSKSVPPSPPAGSETVPPSPPAGSETVPPSPPASSETVPCEKCSKTISESVPSSPPAGSETVPPSPPKSSTVPGQPPKASTTPGKPSQSSSTPEKPPKSKTPCIIPRPPKSSSKSVPPPAASTTPSTTTSGVVPPPPASTAECTTCSGVPPPPPPPPPASSTPCTTCDQPPVPPTPTPCTTCDQPPQPSEDCDDDKGNGNGHGNGHGEGHGSGHGSGHGDVHGDVHGEGHGYGGWN